MKSSYKNIEFYILYHELKPIFDYMHTSIIESFGKAIGSPVEVQVNDKYTTIVHIIESTDNGIFGILSKKHFLKDDALQRIILNSTEDTINSEDLIIEDFTYFLIRPSDFKVAVICNNKAPKFLRSMNCFFKKLEDSYKYEDLHVVRMLSDMNTINKRAKKLSKISVIAYNDKIEKDKSLISIFHRSQNHLKSVSTTYRFNDNYIKDDDVDWTANKELLRGRYDSLTATYETDEESFDVDLINEIITLKISIEGLNEQLKNFQDLDKIKEALMFSFTKLF